MFVANPYCALQLWQVEASVQVAQPVVQAVQEEAAAGEYVPVVQAAQVRSVFPSVVKVLAAQALQALVAKEYPPLQEVQSVAVRPVQVAHPVLHEVQVDA